VGAGKSGVGDGEVESELDAAMILLFCIELTLFAGA